MFEATVSPCTEKFGEGVNKGEIMLFNNLAEEVI